MKNNINFHQDVLGQTIVAYKFKCPMQTLTRTYFIIMKIVMMKFNLCLLQFPTLQLIIYREERDT